MAFSIKEFSGSVVPFVGAAIQATIDLRYPKETKRSSSSSNGIWLKGLRQIFDCLEKSIVCPSNKSQSLEKLLPTSKTNTLAPVRSPLNMSSCMNTDLP